MSNIKLSSATFTYDVPLQAIRDLLAKDLNVPADELTVEYVIGDVGLVDLMDRYNPPRGVVGIKVQHRTK